MLNVLEAWFVFNGRKNRVKSKEAWALDEMESQSTADNYTKFLINELWFSSVTRGRLEKQL